MELAYSKVTDKMVGTFSKIGPGFDREGGAATYNFLDLFQK